MQIACMLVASFGDAATAARFSTALQWISVLRLVRLPKAFSIVKASYLPPKIKLSVTMMFRWHICSAAKNQKTLPVCLKDRCSVISTRVHAETWPYIWQSCFGRSTQLFSLSMVCCRPCLWRARAAIWEAS